MMTLALALLRHPALRAIEREVMYRRHPARYAGSVRFVPAVHRDPVHGPSIYLYAFSKYNDRLMPDGNTIEYHPSTSAAVEGRLAELVGSEVTLFAQLGRSECREGRVRVDLAPARGVYHLVIQPLDDVPPAAPGLAFGGAAAYPDLALPLAAAAAGGVAAAGRRSVSWADMIDD